MLSRGSRPTVTCCEFRIALRWSCLLTLLTLSPLLWTNIRAPVATELTATDASGHACAVVSAEIGERTAAELWRVRDRRRGYVRCESEAESVARTAWLEGDSEEQALALAAFEDRIDELADMTEHERQFGWVGELADSLGWREDVHYRVGLAEHIDLKEAKRARTGPEFAALRRTRQSTARAGSHC